MKQLFAILFLCMLCMPAKAQWRVGMSGGWDYNTISIDTQYAYDMKYTGRGGMTFALTGQYDLTDWIGIRTELAYMQKGQKMERTSDIMNGSYHNTRNQYLQLPVMTQFSFGGKRIRGFVNTGGYVGHWLKRSIEGYNNDLCDEFTYNEASPFNSLSDKRFEAGLVGGLGAEYRMAQHILISAEARYYYALTQMQKRYQELNVTPSYNNTLALQLGVQYSF